MPFNLAKAYNQLLELDHYSPGQRVEILKKIFNRDFVEKGSLTFRGKPVYPIHSDPTAFDVLFNHLTREVVDKATKKREFEMARSKRLHWVRHHIDETRPDKIAAFSVDDPDGIRTYIFDETENYVIILSPKTLSAANNNYEVYYLLTAYHLELRNIEKVRKKYKRRLPDLH
jgi:hypothetical protein